MKFFKHIDSLTTSLAHLYLSVIGCLALWIVIPMALLWTPTVVISGSMEPQIMTGDVVSAQGISESQVRAGAIKAGMVVLAVNPVAPETLYTHRVIKIMPDKSMITKGDANAAADPIPLSPENVRGIERMRIPFIGLPAQKIHAGDHAAVAAMALSVLLALLIARRAKIRERKTSDSKSETPAVATWAKTKVASKPKRGLFEQPFAYATTILAVIIVFVIGGSSAIYTGQVIQANNSWTAAATFPAYDPTVAMCGGAVYTSVANTTVTCAVGAVAGTTKNYILTVTGTGALTQWSVTTDWNNVTDWLRSKAFGPGVADTGNITMRNGYQIMGSTNSCQTTANCNYGYVSSTKPAVVFTVQVTTK